MHNPVLFLKHKAKSPDARGAETKERKDEKSGTFVEF